MEITHKIIFNKNRYPYMYLLCGYIMPEDAKGTKNFVSKVDQDITCVDCKKLMDEIIEKQNRLKEIFFKSGEQRTPEELTEIKQLQNRLIDIDENVVELIRSSRYSECMLTGYTRTPEEWVRLAKQNSPIKVVKTLEERIDARNNRKELLSNLCNRFIERFEKEDNKFEVLFFKKAKEIVEAW